MWEGLLRLSIECLPWKKNKSVPSINVKRGDNASLRETAKRNDDGGKC